MRRPPCRLLPCNRRYRANVICRPCKGLKPALFGGLFLFWSHSLPPRLRVSAVSIRLRLHWSVKHETTPRQISHLRCRSHTLSPTRPLGVRLPRPFERGKVEPDQLAPGPEAGPRQLHARPYADHQLHRNLLEARPAAP